MESCKEFMKNCKVSEPLESCKEFVRRILKCLTEWRTVRCLLGEL